MATGMTSPGAPQAPKSERRLAGWRLVALAEIAGFLAIALLIDWYFFAGDRFYDVQPHPFWIIVLLIAAQYGTNEALVAAIAATAALLVGNLPPQKLGEDLYAWLLDLARNPILWLGTVILIGEIGGRHRTRIRDLTRDLEEARRREAVMDEAYRKISSAKDQLEVRVAGQMKTVMALYQAAKAIDRLRPEEVMQGVDQIVRAILGPKAYSVFLLEGRTLNLALAEGWPAADSFERRFDAASLLFQAVIGERRVVCVAQPDDLAALANEGVIAGPLVSSETGEVLGMLKIEDIGFLAFNLSTIENFRVTCEWIATAYAHALRYEHAEATRAYGRDRTLFAAGFQERLTRLVIDLGRRTGFDVASLQVRVQGAESLPPERRAKVAVAVGRAVEERLRDTDLAFENHRSGWEFEVLLPATPAANAAVAAEKLRRELGQILAQESALLSVSIAVRTLHEAKP